MIPDRENKYRPLLEEEGVSFDPIIADPWQTAPDSETLNQAAFRTVTRELRSLERERKHSQQTDIGVPPKSKGVLIQGPPGSGKTHLLSRVRRLLYSGNSILFVRIPADPDSVMQHIWLNIFTSLTKKLDFGNGTKSQLDDLLAHVFCDILIPIFQIDIERKVDVVHRQQWIDILKADAGKLFSLLGRTAGDEEETSSSRRANNINAIRNRTLAYIRQTHAGIDGDFAHALITYCLTASELRKRSLLDWLQGRELSEEEARICGLPRTFAPVDEESTDAAVQTRREAWCFRAITSIATLSTHYQPLIMAFDQLEGLRNNERLTTAWGHAVREIFTHAPNTLIVTCIFPDLWQDWFLARAATDPDTRSVTDRIGAVDVKLESFQPHQGLELLIGRMKHSRDVHMLPTPIYPFEEADIPRLANGANSARQFLRHAQQALTDWLNDEVTPPPPPVDHLIRTTIENFKTVHTKSYGNSTIPDEQDFAARLLKIFENSLSAFSEKAEPAKATAQGQRVMPPGFVFRTKGDLPWLCITASNAKGNPLAACVRNLLDMVQKTTQSQQAIFVRDIRCAMPGRVTLDNLTTFTAAGGVEFMVTKDEHALLYALYDTLIAVQERDLSIGTHLVTKVEFACFLKNENMGKQSRLFEKAIHRFPPLRRVLISDETPQPPLGGPNLAPMLPAETARKVSPPVPNAVIGSLSEGTSQTGILGALDGGQKRVAVSFSKPMGMVILGYMGSGKSYALGVLVENALLQIPNVTNNERPMAVVAFNYRQNAEARFEYAGFMKPNAKPVEVARLQTEYDARPQGISRMNILGYGPELERRKSDYEGIRTLPISFRSDELNAAHWEILMKPANSNAEYMAVVRTLIRDLFYADRLTCQNLKQAIQTDDRLSPDQRRRATTRMSFAEDWISDSRAYEWGELLAAGCLTIVDLRMQNLPKEDALRLCLIITDMIRRTRNGVNKMIVFDEAHEYVDCKDLVGDLENALTQIRHDGLSYVMASQFPEKIPESLFKYLLTRLVFKLPNAKSVKSLQKGCSNMGPLSEQKVANLVLERGECYIQTDDDCTEPLLKTPQLLSIRPRCSQHGGETVRNLAPEAAP